MQTLRLGNPPYLYHPTNLLRHHPMCTTQRKLFINLRRPRTPKILITNEMAADDFLHDPPRNSFFILFEIISHSGIDLTEYTILNKIREVEAKLDQLEAHLNRIDYKLDEIKHNLP